VDGKGDGSLLPKMDERKSLWCNIYSYGIFFFNLVILLLLNDDVAFRSQNLSPYSGIVNIKYDFHIME